MRRGASSLFNALPMMAVLVLGGCNAPAPHELVTTNLALPSMDDAALADVSLSRKRVGVLELPDGKVAVGDPMVSPDIPPMVRSVTPGAYPVDIIWSEPDRRVAAGIMRFSDARIARWEIAAQPGQDHATLGPADFFPANVDSGLAMFASSRFAAAFNKRMALLKRKSKNPNYYDDFLAKEMGNDTSFLLHFPLPEDRTAGAAIIQSGWGDGIYPVFWGLDENDRPVVLLIDFYVVDDANGIPRAERSLSAQAFMALNGLMSRLREAAETAKSQPTPP